MWWSRTSICDQCRTGIGGHRSMRQAVQRHVCTGCWLGLLFDLPPPWGEGGVCKSWQPLVLGFLSEFLKNQVASIWREFLECTDKKNLITLEANLWNDPWTGRLLVWPFVAPGAGSRNRRMLGRVVPFAPEGTVDSSDATQFKGACCTRLLCRNLKLQLGILEKESYGVLLNWCSDWGERKTSRARSRWNSKRGGSMSIVCYSV